MTATMFTAVTAIAGPCDLGNYQLKIHAPKMKRGSAVAKYEDHGVIFPLWVTELTTGTGSPGF